MEFTFRSYSNWKWFRSSTDSGLSKLWKQKSGQDQVNINVKRNRLTWTCSYPHVAPKTFFRCDFPGSGLVPLKPENGIQVEQLPVQVRSELWAVICLGQDRVQVNQKGNSAPQAMKSEVEWLQLRKRRQGVFVLSVVIFI